MAQTTDEARLGRITKYSKMIVDNAAMVSGMDEFVEAISIALSSIMITSRPDGEDVTPQTFAMVLSDMIDIMGRGLEHQHLIRKAMRK